MIDVFTHNKRLVLVENLTKKALFCRCGYVLQPPSLNDVNYDPFDKGTLLSVDPMTISLVVRICICIYFLLSTLAQFCSM